MPRRNAELGNLTAVLIVDREDLDDQTSEPFVTDKRLLYEEDARSIETRTDLKVMLRMDLAIMLCKNGCFSFLGKPRFFCAQICSRRKN